MEGILSVVKFISLHWMELLLGIQGVMASLIVVAAVIPGDQPDKALQSALDWLLKFSVKKQ